MPNPSTIAMEEEENNAALSINPPKSVGVDVSIADAPVIQEQLQAAWRRAADLTVENVSLRNVLEGTIVALKEMRESRDRLLIANNEVLEELRTLRRIAEATVRCAKATIDFNVAADNGVPTDAQTEEAANAEGDLITLLVAAGYLDPSDEQYFEQSEPA